MSFAPTYTTNPEITTSILSQHAYGSRMNGNSGQFMISQFEAEADDDEIEMTQASQVQQDSGSGVLALQVYPHHKDADDVICKYRDQELSIETSLSKLFNCMKLAYR